MLKLLGMEHAQQDLHEAILQSDAAFGILRALIQISFLRKAYKSAASMQQIAVPSCQFLHNTVGLLRVAYLYPCCKARRGISLIWRMLSRAWDAGFCLSVKASLHAELLRYSTNQRTAALSISAEKPV